MVKVLAGFPANAPGYFDERVEGVLRSAYGQEIDPTFCREIDRFTSLYYSQYYDLCIVFDDVRYDGGYCKSIGKRTGNGKFMVIIPDGCRGDASLFEIIRNGFYNVLAQSDFSSPLRVADLVGRNRSLDEVMTYCAVDGSSTFASNLPDVVEKPKAEERKVGSSIRRRYLGGGIGLIQLLGKDADALTLKNVDEDDFDVNLFTGYKLTEEEKNAEMPMRFYEVDPDWVDTARDRLKDRFITMGLLIFNGNDTTHTDAEVRQRAMDELTHMKVTGENAELVLKSFLRDVKSYGRLDVLIHDQDVSDVRMMDFETVTVQSRGKWYRTNVKFRDKKEYETFIQHICNKNNVPFNWTAADVVFPDEKSFPGECMLRNAFTNSNLNVNRTMSGHIRITRKIKKLGEDLVKDGFITEPQMSLLSNMARQKKSMIICGGSGSGKTVLLNCLIEYLPKGICGEIVQESSELFAPNHINIKSSNSIESKGTDVKIEHNLKSLAEKALLRNTDVFIIGEIKGNEAADFYSASRTTSVYTTLHSDNCFGAIPRCAELALAGGAAVKKEEIVSVLARTIDYVVYCDHYEVKQIAEVKGYDERERDVRYVLYDFNAKED